MMEWAGFGLMIHVQKSGRQSPARQQDKPARPGETDPDQIITPRNSCKQVADTKGVVFRPIGLRKHVVHHVETAMTEKSECLFQTLVLPSDGIGKDQIEGRRRLLGDEECSIGANELQTRIIEPNPAHFITRS